MRSNLSFLTIEMHCTNRPDLPRLLFSPLSPSLLFQNKLNHYGPLSPAMAAIFSLNVKKSCNNFEWCLFEGMWVKCNPEHLKSVCQLHEIIRPKEHTIQYVSLLSNVKVGQIWLWTIRKGQTSFQHYDSVWSFSESYNLSYRTVFSLTGEFLWVNLLFQDVFSCQGSRPLSSATSHRWLIYWHLILITRFVVEIQTWVHREQSFIYCNRQRYCIKFSVGICTYSHMCQKYIWQRNTN